MGCRDVWLGSTGELIQHMTTLRLTLKAEFTIDHAKYILRMRQDIAPATKDAVFALVRETEDDIKAQRKKSSGKLLIKGITTEIKVRLFVDKLRKRVVERKEFLEKQGRERSEASYLTVNAKDYVRVELMALSLRETITYTIARMPKGANPTKYLSQLMHSKPKYRQGFFYFDEDLLEWKKIESDKEIESRIYLAAISFVKIFEPKGGKHKI